MTTLNDNKSCDLQISQSNLEYGFALAFSTVWTPWKFMDEYPMRIRPFIIIRDGSFIWCALLKFTLIMAKGDEQH